MQGLINLATAIADSIAVALPAFCYLSACGCFFFFAWSLWRWSEPPSRYQHHKIDKPWVPFISLILSGVLASFPHFLTMANVSAGTGMTVGLTTYAATTPPTGSSVLGATPDASVVNVVQMFQYIFEAFGAACVYFSIMRWRSIINGAANGSLSACGVQFVFGVLCINILTVATGIESFFNTGG
jgi:hypothetical protein